MRYELMPRHRVLLLALPTLVSIGATAPGWYGGPRILLVVGAIVVCLTWWGHLSVPYSLELKEDASVEFRSWLGRRIIRLADVQSVNAGRWNRGFVTVRSRSTVVNLLAAMPGLDPLLHGIRQCNPSAIIKGQR